MKNNFPQWLFLFLIGLVKLGELYLWIPLVLMYNITKTEANTPQISYNKYLFYRKNVSYHWQIHDVLMVESKSFKSLYGLAVYSTEFVPRYITKSGYCQHQAYVQHELKINIVNKLLLLWGYPSSQQKAVSTQKLIPVRKP